MQALTWGPVTVPLNFLRVPVRLIVQLGAAASRQVKPCAGAVKARPPGLHPYAAEKGRGHGPRQGE